MSDIAIQVENLGKLYRIGQRERYKTLRDTLTGAMYAPFRRLRSMYQHSNVERANNNNTIWALRGVSFEVKQGEVLGIIGRNGAGKTTLLKILSRITEPSEGYAKIRGRVSSLLEVGTGFHPELTGRENIYLNGAILGMKRSEIERKFDEIAAFFEMDKFLDTPVKHYSSGMYVRLAFAVAAHLEPDVLLVDEVLAVGDLEFRRKCLRAMDSIVHGGRTVLFVSHDVNAIRQLCGRTILLDMGQVVAAGLTNEVVNLYESTGVLRDNQEGDSVFVRPSHDIAGKQIWFSRVGLHDAQGNPCNHFMWGDTLEIRINLEGEAPQDEFVVEWQIHNEKGDLVAYGGSGTAQGVYFRRGTQQVSCTLRRLPLTVGTYHLWLGVRIFHLPHWDAWSGIPFRVEGCDPYGTGWNFRADRWGDVYIDQHWEPLFIEHV